MELHELEDGPFRRIVVNLVDDDCSLRGGVTEDDRKDGGAGARPKEKNPHAAYLGGRLKLLSTKMARGLHGPSNQSNSNPEAGGSSHVVSSRSRLGLFERPGHFEGEVRRRQRRRKDGPHSFERFLDWSSAGSRLVTRRSPVRRLPAAVSARRLEPRRQAGLERSHLDARVLVPGQGGSRLLRRRGRG